MVEPTLTGTAPMLERWAAELHGARDDSAALVIGIFDPAGKALYRNRGMAQVLGKHHGGRIEVESTVGQGAAFTVLLPERQS